MAAAKEECEKLWHESCAADPCALPDSDTQRVLIMWHSGATLLELSRRPRVRLSPLFDLALVGRREKTLNKVVVVCAMFGCVPVACALCLGSQVSC